MCPPRSTRISIHLAYRITSAVHSAPARQGHRHLPTDDEHTRDIKDTAIVGVGECR